MTIYDVLEKMIAGERFGPGEQETAVRLIRGMRQMNTLGTVTGLMDLKTHDCFRAGQYWPDSGRCGFCMAAMPVDPHQCSPVTRWQGSRWDVHGNQAVQCRFCGKDM